MVAHDAPRCDTGEEQPWKPGDVWLQQQDNNHILVLRFCPSSGRANARVTNPESDTEF